MQGCACGASGAHRIDAIRIADLPFDVPSLDAFAEAWGLSDELQGRQIAAHEAQ